MASEGQRKLFLGARLKRLRRDLGVTQERRRRRARAVAAAVWHAEVVVARCHDDDAFIRARVEKRQQRSSGDG